MNYRDELVALIGNGTSPADLYSHFRLERHLGRSTIIDLFHQAGLTIPIPPSDDEISDERRRQIQQLSLS